MAREIDERLLTRIWMGQWIEASRLRTVEGRSLQVVFPGRPNGGRGPDFLGAIIALEGGQLLKGDVELHVAIGDWLAHGHHRDPAYNSAVVHVVWNTDALWTEREDGARIATVSLKGSVVLPVEALMEDSPPDPPFYEGCRQVAERLGPERVGEVLDRAGDARFMARGTYYQGELDRGGEEPAWAEGFPAQRHPVEVLYRGLMGALGYSKNQEPFQRLAECMPYASLERITSGLSSSQRATVMAASLLGVAGLLPSQKGGSATGFPPLALHELEAVWRGARLTSEMGAEDWETFRTRPANHPRCRIIGAAHLLARFAATGLLERFEKLVADAACGAGPGLIETALVVPRYLGRERAREMVVNVVLPFVWALGEHRSQSSLCEASLGLYRAVAKGRGNRVTRQMADQLLGDEGRGVVDSGRRQQGLIHLFKGACRHGYCAGCPLGRGLALARETEGVGRRG